MSHAYKQYMYWCIAHNNERFPKPNIGNSNSLVAAKHMYNVTVNVFQILNFVCIEFQMQKSFVHKHFYIVIQKYIRTDF